MNNSILSLFTCSLLLLTSTAGAQAPGPKSALLVSAGTNQPGADANQFGAFSLEYRRSRSRGRSYRLGVYYGRSDSYTSSVRSLGLDSQAITFRQSAWHFFGLSGALETERPFHRKVYMAAGLEGRIAYGRQGRASVGTSYYGPQTPGGAYGPGLPAVPPRPQQAFGLQGRPYLGARLYLGSRVLLGLDFGPTADLNCVFRRDRTTNVTDLEVALFTGAFRLGVRL